uniref:K Homology domain-containing protein n=1 Tax=Acrobeloides nanus TaxID=290746 RepID=A0A914DHL1_9BILA
TSNNAIGVKRTQDDDLNLEPAKKFLEDLPTTSENQEIVTMIDVPPSYTGLVVGKGGFKINQIKSESGCSVAKLAPQTHPETRQFILKGTPEQVNCAKMLIQNVVDAAKLTKNVQNESQLQVSSQSNVPHLPIEVVTIEV